MLLRITSTVRLSVRRGKAMRQAMRLPQLPNLGSNLFRPFCRASSVRAEPANKLLMNRMQRISRRFATSESWQDGTRLRFVFADVLVVERDSNWVVPKEERRYGIEQEAIVRF